MPVMGKALVLAALAMDPGTGNWCKAGESVVIPDGREGPVVHVERDLCSVLAYGEKYPKRWAFYLLEPTNPRYGR